MKQTAKKIAEKDISSATQVITDEQPATSNRSEEDLVLRLRPQNEPRVRWATETVDNEHLGRKKSKCCCIYKKKRNWDESDSSESDCETGHCRGHVDKHKTVQDSGGENHGQPTK